MNSNWNYDIFDNVFAWCQKSNIGSTQGLNSGKYKLYIASAKEIKYYDDYMENGETLIFGTGGNPCIHYETGKFAYTNHCEAAKPKIDVCTKFYYYYFQKDKYHDLQSTFVGGGIKNSSKKRIGKLYVPVPTVDEQQRIVDKIEELFSKLDKGVEELNKIKDQLKIYRQAVLKEAFDGKWDYCNRKSVNVEAVDDSLISELPTLPKEWKYVFLSRLGELSRGKSKHRPRNDKKLFQNGKYPFIQTGDVKSANKYLTTYSSMYGDFGLAQSKLWKKGTLCITIAANIAETCILGIDACFPDSIVGFDPQENIVERDYVRYFIESSKVRLSAFAPATAQKNINLTTLENLIIPYCDIEEQKYIVAEIESRLSVCDKLEQTVSESLQKAESLRQSILKQAFEGKLI